MAGAADLENRDFLLLPSVEGFLGVVPFATMITRVAGPAGSGDLVVAVHTVSMNSAVPYSPPSYWHAGGSGSDTALGAGIAVAAYHLEVVNPDGLTVLGVGEDEVPGAPSPHLPVLRDLMAQGRAAALFHQPGPSDSFEPHVMAAVPLESSGFWLVLEQPADVALGLPLEARRNVLVLAALGYIAALVTAWITTRHVVKPVKGLMAAAQRMAQGDLETPVGVAAQDEVGTLAQSLDLMRRQLQAAYTRIEETNRGLEAQVKERTARLGEVLDKVISTQEDERHRVARELHDETAQTLAALCIALDRVRGDLSQGPPEALERVLEAKAHAVRLLEETRRLILDLRPTLLDDLGLGPAIRSYAETHLEERGVAVSIEIEDRAARLPRPIEVSLFRVAQEAMSNIARHANARHAVIRLARPDGTVRVVISDDGKGFDLSKVLGPGTKVERVGLVGMQERIRLLNGRLDIRSRRGEGTAVTVEIPVPEEQGTHGRA